MQLSVLLQGICNVTPEANRDIHRILLDSRQIQPGDLFIAIKGKQQDGMQFIPQAIKQGAAAILLDDHSHQAITWQGQTPIIPVTQLAQQIGEIAARFYGRPAESMKIIGVTGTNGKTSCTHFVAEILQSHAIQCGIIGTLGSGLYGRLGTAGLTTPDAVTLQSLLAEFKQQHTAAIAMEVSSHSIDQGRINAIPFEIGVFTNLSQDHLDYHGDMQSYAAVKHRFLAAAATKRLVINADDAYALGWLQELAGQKPVVAYSVSITPPKLLANVELIHAQHVKLTRQGIHAHISSPWGEGELTLPLIGMFNLSNALAVLGVLCLYGIPFMQAMTSLARISSVPGRMQMLSGYRGKPVVVVDYAHTPDALEKVLQSLRAHTSGKLWCVFGCGGDRDAGKRPQMAAIAENLSDQIIVTNDNPRHESPAEIAQQIQQGFMHPERVFIELDRSKAIQNSIQWAKEGDCVLIAGKGAEQYQQIGDQKLPFNDVEQADRWLSCNS